MVKKIIHSLNLLFKYINKIFNGRSKKITVILRALMATTIGILLSFLFVDALIFSTVSMFSSPEKKDNIMSDMFAQIADRRPVRKFEDRIVVINIGHSDRYEIAEALSLLSLFGPKVVGIDINFENNISEDDYLLVEAIKSLPASVLPLGVTQNEENPSEFSIKEKPFFYGEEGLNYGVVNLPQTIENGTIRDYAISFPTSQGNLPSFPLALAEIYNPRGLENLNKHNSGTGVISYHSKHFKIIGLNDIEDNADDLSDKIVLIGSLDDSSDIFATPINFHTPGILIHASALSTILDRVWYFKIQKIFDYIIAASICFLFMLASFGFKEKYKNYKGLTLRFLQGLMVLLLVLTGYSLYVDRNIIFDTSFTIMIVTFGFLASDIWIGLEAIWNTCSEKINKLDIKLNHNN